MIICPNCNAQLEDNASYCPNCGTQFVVQQEDYSAATTVLTADMQPQYQAGQQQYQQPYGGQQYQQQTNAQNYQQPQTYVGQSYQQPGSQNYQQQPYVGQPYQQGAPIAQLRTNRSFIKTLLLSAVTFGIYALICYGHITDDVNLVCSRYDGRKSMNYYLLFFLVGPITLGIAMIVWMHNICDRMGNELKRRQIDYNFGAKDFWLWGVLGSLIIVGPFVFAHKFFKSINKINESYNQFG